MSEITSIAITEHEKQVNELKAQIDSLTGEIKFLKTDHNLEKVAGLNFQMQQCRLLAATAKMSPEEVYFLAIAGSELGMTIMQSLKSLYIIKGRASFYGAGLISRLSGQGWKINYINETPNGVTGVVNKGEEVYEYVVVDTEPIFKNSVAFKNDKITKMRHHAIKMIANFNLPHLLGSVGVWDNDDIESAQRNEKSEDFDSVIERLKNCQTKEELDKIKEEHKKLCSLDIIILGHIGEAKKRLGL